MSKTIDCLSDSCGFTQGDYHALVQLKGSLPAIVVWQRFISRSTARKYRFFFSENNHVLGFL
jgi:hypothetical protein